MLSAGHQISYEIFLGKAELFIDMLIGDHLVNIHELAMIV